MPADEASALRAVLTDPEADEPRRAYAELLASSSRPADRARAEFIRLQLDLELLSNTDPRWPTLVGRERELIDRHRAVWEKPLRDLFRPPFASPVRWLRSHLFGSGGLWGFHRGFIEHVLAPAPTFLAEDVALIGHAPIRRVVLAHASEYIGQLVRDPRLESLGSLHLVGDMELDDDLNVLVAGARDNRLTVLEFRLPRLWPDVEDLFEVLRSPDGEDGGRDLEDFPAWSAACPEARVRLAELATSPRVGLLHADPAHEGELLALNEWVYLGDTLAEAGAWAVAKSHQDPEDEDGRCRRLVLLREGKGDELRELPHYHGEVR